MIHYVDWKVQEVDEAGCDQTSQHSKRFLKLITVHEGLE